MLLAAGSRGAALLVLALVTASSTLSAHAYALETTPEPWVGCTLVTGANEQLLEDSLTPSNGSTVPSGTPVSFSGESQSPLSFAVASSPAALSDPDIDDGLGGGQLDPGSGPEPVSTYTFTSTSASAIPRTVYWEASFSNATFPLCAGLEGTDTTTAVRSITVTPNTPGPAPEPTSVHAQTAQVSISGPDGLSRAHPAVAYAIECTGSCTGDTYYHALTIPRHGKAHRIPQLDFGPSRVSIADHGDGAQRFDHRYRGSAQRILDRLLRGGGVLELQISVKVTSASGLVARAQITARLR